jgi:preprotein translocase subunit SecY
VANFAEKGSLKPSRSLEELFSRLKFLVLALIVYRIGSHIPVPGIDPDQLKQLFGEVQGTILGLANMFSGVPPSGPAIPVTPILTSDCKA